MRKRKNTGKREAYVCPECGKLELIVESIARCPRCAVRMENCGTSRDHTKLAMMTPMERIRLANSA
jgi:ribosomal protein L37AE/L43A